MKGKVLKNKKDILKKAIISGCAAGLLFFSIQSCAKNLGRYDDLTNEESFLYADIRASESYQEHIETAGSSIYNLYRNGVISANEYNSKMEYLHSNKYILDNGYTFLNEDIYSKLKETIQEEDSVFGKAFLSVIGIGGGAGIAIGTILSNDNDEKECVNQTTHSMEM